MFLRENNKGFKIRTPDGFKDFAGIECTSYDQIYRIELGEEYYLECNINHKLFLDTETRITVENLKVGDMVLSEVGYIVVNSIELTDRVEPVYDVIEVSDNHRFFTNGIVSSNCEFVTHEETLVDAVKLRLLRSESTDPIMSSSKMGKFKKYKEIERNKTYVLALDPAGGTGGNNSAIQVYELPSLKQVAEWHDNKTDIPGQIRMVLGLLNDIAGKVNNPDEQIYWSIENNNIGEAGIIYINEMGQSHFPGIMMNEPKRTRTGKIKHGLTTTGHSKKTACFKLKKLIEQNKLEIKSIDLINELNNFVAHGNSSKEIYKAKSGTTDDIVSAMLVIVRIIDMVERYDSTLSEITQEALVDDSRMPLGIMTLNTRL